MDQDTAFFLFLIPSKMMNWDGWVGKSRHWPSFSVSPALNSPEHQEHFFFCLSTKSGKTSLSFFFFQIPILHSFKGKKVQLKFLSYSISTMWACGTNANLFHITIYFNSQGENCLFIKSISRGEEFFEADSKVQVLAGTCTFEVADLLGFSWKGESLSLQSNRLLFHTDWIPVSPKRWINFSLTFFFWRNRLFAEDRPHCCHKLPITDVTAVWRKK